MIFQRPSFSKAPASSSIPTKSAPGLTTKRVGDAAEDAALAYLEKQGLCLVVRNFKTPGRGGGEVDLIMRAPDGTLVFVEVRKRRSASHGGAAASVSSTKQRRIVLAARHYLARLGSVPPCRFDVVAIEGANTELKIEWLRAAFDAS
jgi:putative endonuclease